MALEKGVDLNDIAEVFGHTRVSTTEKSYVNRNRQKAVDSFKNFTIKRDSQEPSRLEKGMAVLDAIDKM